MSVRKNYLGDTSSKTTDKVPFFNLHQADEETENIDLFCAEIDCKFIFWSSQEYDLWDPNNMHPDWNINQNIYTLLWMDK